MAKRCGRLPLCKHYQTGMWTIHMKVMQWMMLLRVNRFELSYSWFHTRIFPSSVLDMVKEMG